MENIITKYMTAYSIYKSFLGHTLENIEKLEPQLQGLQLLNHQRLAEPTLEVIMKWQ